MGSERKKNNRPYEILNAVLAMAEEADYSGFSKFDALNSPWVESLTFDNKWLRLIATQVVKQCPFHIRPLLGVKKSRNPKGIALFARACLHLYGITGDSEMLDKAGKLIDWLLENPSPGHKRLCWGYNFVWQNTIFLQDEFEPNAVVTTFVGEALVHAYRVTKEEKYLAAARSVCGFFLEDLPVLADTPDERAIAYVQRDVDAVVLNNQVLTGALMVKVWRHTREDILLETATRQMNYTVNRATEYHAWYYTEPYQRSPITHDNYHTGGILDGLIEYFEETGDDRFLRSYWDGLDFYRDRLFEEDGAPRWMHDRKYPFDVHGSAQGIITFGKAAVHDPDYAAVAVRIMNWALDHLYRPERRDFIYRQGRFVTWNYSLMRWCNAWMARALAFYISSRRKAPLPAGTGADHRQF